MLELSPLSPFRIEPDYPFEERVVAMRDGLKLYCRDYNPSAAGTPVLCLSGVTRNSADFHRLAADLAQGGRRVLAPDYRGRGRSGRDPNWRNYRPLRLLRDVMTLTQSLKVDHAIVVGTSLGGLLTMGLSVLRPSFVRAAVINDIGPDVHTNGVARIIAYIGHDHPQPDWDAALLYTRTVFTGIGLSSDQDWRDLTAGSFALGEDGLLHNAWDPAIARCMAGARSPLPLWLLFRGLRHIPTLLVRGGHSDVLSEETALRMQAVKPDLRRVTVAHAGHTPTLNEPECRSAIASLLDKIE